MRTKQRLRRRARGASLALGLVFAGLVAGAGACNTGLGDCPATSTIKPNGPCTDDNLECPYDLSSQPASCNGTLTTIKTSCVCTKGTWSCPPPVNCSGDTAGGG
jgi:hypothetical protein